ncbi:MAG: 1-acyl-sn-glycerol-3-phosphate acyltransferase [Candidatus Fermentibacteraceae bacterium]|nr:1-acyl-sn-glycerol-3-phosphate acyltransferase [Candidatus Fermentibacteraceae bacterium]
MKESIRIRIQYYGGLISRLLFGFTVYGAERVPRTGGVIIACNHISEMDPPVLGFAIPRPIAFMAKTELFRSRTGNFIFKELNTIPVNRTGVDTNAIRSAVDYLRNGVAVVIFPEGTRSRDSRLLPGKAGISLIASASKAPILPAFIWGTDHPRKAMLRTGNPFSIHFGKLIPSSRIMTIRKKYGAKAVAEKVMLAIAEIGINSKLYASDETILIK